MTSQQRELILSQRATLPELRTYLHAHSEAGTEQQRQAVQLYLARYILAGACNHRASQLARMQLEACNCSCLS